MPERAADLPTFAAPPVAEVVLGVQFGALDRLFAPHFGAVWQLLRDEFSVVEEHPPIAPAFETFGKNPQGRPRVAFQITATPDLPRTFFVNEARTRIIQVQRDRFIHNWRKAGDQDTYPRFEGILATFMTRYRDFASYIKQAQIGTVEPNQCEISYINHIPFTDSETPYNVANDLFGGIISGAELPGLGRPNDGRLLFRYTLRDPKGEGFARLIANCEPALRFDNRTILQFTLTVRGIPTSATMEGIEQFMSVGREHIVRSFKALTSAKMHKQWKLVQ